VSGTQFQRERERDEGEDLVCVDRSIGVGIDVCGD
jgi:hypothetical protein